MHVSAPFFLFGRSPSGRYVPGSATLVPNVFGDSPSQHYRRFVFQKLEKYCLNRIRDLFLWCQKCKVRNVKYREIAILRYSVIRILRYSYIKVFLVFLGLSLIPLKVDALIDSFLNRIFHYDL